MRGDICYSFPRYGELTGELSNDNEGQLLITWWSPATSRGSVVRGVSLPLFVRVRADEGGEEQLQEGDRPPEEVRDGTQAPGLGLEHPPIRGNVNHRALLSESRDYDDKLFLISMRLMILSSFSL